MEVLWEDAALQVGWWQGLVSLQGQFLCWCGVMIAAMSLHRW